MNDKAEAEANSQLTRLVGKVCFYREQLKLCNPESPEYQQLHLQIQHALQIAGDLSAQIRSTKFGTAK